MGNINNNKYNIFIFIIFIVNISSNFVALVYGDGDGGGGGSEGGGGADITGSADDGGKEGFGAILIFLISDNCIFGGADGFADDFADGFADGFGGGVPTASDTVDNAGAGANILIFLIFANDGRGFGFIALVTAGPADATTEAPNGFSENILVPFILLIALLGARLDFDGTASSPNKESGSESPLGESFSYFRS